MLLSRDSGHLDWGIPHILMNHWNVGSNIDDVRKKACKMEAVGSVQGDNSAHESDDSSDKAWSTVTEMCRKNGVNLHCLCGEKSSRSIEGKVTKVGCIVKLNGVGKMPIKPSIPTLRSRGVQTHVTLESSRCRRRSTKSDQPENTPW